MKNILFLSSWFPSKVHSTLGNFVKYHALAASKFNKIYVLYIVADDSVNGYQIDSFKENNLSITIVYFRRGFIKYFNYIIAFRKGLKFLITKKSKNRFSSYEYYASRCLASTLFKILL